MVIRVPPLPVPGPQPITLASALQVEAVRLFLERVRLVQPDFGLTEGNVPAVVRICESLEGLPLALELAAARAHVLPIERLAERLDDRFRLLSGGSRRSPPRQQTLQATIDWSYTLLSGQEQGLLRQLSVFAGGWTLEAAEAICVIDGDVLDGLSMLIDKSMVQEPESATGGRYRFLETIRDDAAQRLKKSGEQDAVRQRHAAYYLWLVETAEPELRGAQQDVWLDRLEADYDNLLAAMAWWVQRNHQEQVLRFTAALRGLWETRGPAAVGLAWLERAIQQPGGSRAARARALNAAGALAVLLGDDPRAQEFWSESLALSRMLGDRRRIAGLLNNLAHVREHTGDYAGAISYYQESLAIHQDLNNRWGVAGCYCNLGEVARRQGRYEQAVSLLGESLRLFHEVEDKASAAIVLGNLALIARTRGDYDGATALLQESFGLFQAVGDPPGVAECLEGLAGIAALRGEEERAARLGGAAEALRQSLDVPIPSDVREQYLRDIAQARDRIDHAAWNTAWTEGRALSPDQSAAYALTTDNDR
jgi:non-specific serine/threonine protein kinase